LTKVLDYVLEKGKVTFKELVQSEGKKSVVGPELVCLVLA
jgi:hypothetical protein